MGGGVSRPPGARQMVLYSLSRKTHFEKGELSKLHVKFRELAAKEGNPYTITLADFQEALRYFTRRSTSSPRSIQTMFSSSWIRGVLTLGSGVRPQLPKLRTTCQNWLGFGAWHEASHMLAAITLGRHRGLFAASNLADAMLRRRVRVPALAHATSRADKGAVAWIRLAGPLGSLGALAAAWLWRRHSIATEYQNTYMRVNTTMPNINTRICEMVGHQHADVRLRQRRDTGSIVSIMLTFRVEAQSV